MNNYCWTTLLSTDNFLLGVLGLAFSLQKVQTDYPLIVLAANNLSQATFNILDKYNISYVKYPPLTFNKDDYYGCTINKFYAWKLTDFDKVCFIDADTVVMTNIDFFFSFQPFSSCVDNDGRVFGALFLLKPNNDFADYIFNNLINDYHTDEEILNLIYHEQLHKTNNWLPDSPCFVWHDAYTPKYWDMFGLSTPEDINLFVKNQSYIFLLKWLNYVNPYTNFYWGSKTNE